MLNPNSNPWRAERKGLDIKSVLAELEDRRQVIKEHGWNEGSFDAVWDEACKMGPLIRQLQREIGAWYCQVMAVIEAYNAEE